MMRRATVAADLKTPPIDDVLRSLRAVQRRMLGQAFLATLARGALIVGGVLVVLGAERRWLLGELPWDGRLAGWVGLAALGVVLLVTLARRRSLPQAAAAIDGIAGTRDRFVSALAFSREADAPELQALAVRECSDFIRRGNFAQLVRVRVPRELAWLLVPAITLAILQWEARSTFGERDAVAAAAREEVEDTAQQLEQLARDAEKQNETQKTDELKRLAEELRRSAEQIRKEAKTSEEAEKAALRELSELEKLVQEMQKQPGTPSPEELRELAKALEKKEETKEAAASMEAGDLAKAAEQLEKAMQQLAEKGDERTKEEIDQALKDALDKMAAQQKLSEALQQLAQKMKDQSGQKGDAMEIPKELAEMLKKLAQQQQGKGQQNQQQGKPMDEQSLKNLLAALQNLKFGDGQPQGGNPQPGPGGTITMQNFGPKGEPGSQGGDPRLPSGQPGGERDTGTTDNPFGKNAGEAPQGGDGKSLTGQLADGETLQQFLPSAGDTSKSRRRYKELYEAMAPAAEDAVVQENIPLGSRFLIKRYFESIRPKE
jgi:chemotaxis protein histidine kinase CheA